MAKEKPVEQPVAIIPMLRSDFIGVLLLGAATGFLVWAIGLVLSRFVFDPFLCQGGDNTQCGSASNYSAILAGLIGAAVSLTGLIRLRVYRPLLVVIAGILSTWGIVQLAWSLQGVVGVIVAVVLYALAFGLFAWLARIREFWVALVAIVVLVTLVRLALVL